MSGEKKFQPTAKKILKAREDGDVAKSRDLTHAVVVSVNVVGIWIVVGRFTEIGVKASQLFDRAAFLNLESTMSLLGEFSGLFLTLATVSVLGGVVASLVVEFCQVGFYFLASNLALKFSRLDIISGVKRMLGYEERGFTLQLPFRMVKMGLFVAIVAYIFWTNLVTLGPNLFTSGFLSASAVTAVLGNEFFKLVCYCLLFMLSFGVIDLLYERIKRRKRLMMDVEEMKQEYKDAEGDPQIKTARRYAQQEICEYSKVNDVRNAKVVITDEVSK